PPAASYDVDMTVSALAAEDAKGRHTTITIASTAGRRVLAPLSAEFISTDGSIDEPTLVDVFIAWKRNYMRWTQAVRRHREMIAAGPRSDVGPVEEPARPPAVSTLGDRAAP